MRQTVSAGRLAHGDDATGSPMTGHGPAGSRDPVADITGGMRVAIVSEAFLPLVNGVSNSVCRVVEHLGRHGHEAMVVAPGAGPDAYLGAPVVRLPAMDLPVVDSLPIGVPTRKVLTALREYRPDVVHLASPFIVGARGLWAARRLGLPTVAVFQTDVAGFASSYGLGFAARTAWRWTRQLHSAADRTLAPSSCAARALADHGIPRVHRWPRGVDTARFRPSRRDDALRSRLAPDGELLVGYVGRLAPEKNVLRLAALCDTPGVRVVVVGDGPDRAELQRRLPGATFLGFLEGDELAAAYASLDVFTHTGSHETFCQAVQEALASGVPVLSPDAGGPRDLVAHGRTGFLLPPDDDAAFGRELRAAVDTLAADPQLRERLGAAARRSVLGRTWPAVCDALLAHYTEVIGCPAGIRRAA